MSKAPGTSSGRPRDKSIDAALKRAFEGLAVDSEIRSISMKDLISRAGTNRDAFYRRYNSLGHFLVDVAVNRYALDPADDTGSLAGDLETVVRDQVAMYTDGVCRELIPLLLDASAKDDVVAELLATQFIHPQRESCRRMLQRAIDRGEIEPPEDSEYVIDLLYGPLLLRAALPGEAPITEKIVRQLARTAMRELGVDPPELGSEPAADLD